MTRRLPTLLRLSPLAAVLLLTTLLTSICMTPSEVQAKRQMSLTVPGSGGGPAFAPGQGDDDEPTADNGPAVGRWTNSVSTPDADSGGGSPHRRFTTLRVVKRLFGRASGYAKRLVGYIP